LVFVYLFLFSVAGFLACLLCTKIQDKYQSHMAWLLALLRRRKRRRAHRVTQVIERLPSKHEAMNSTPVLPNNNNNNNNNNNKENAGEARREAWVPLLSHYITRMCATARALWDVCTCIPVQDLAQCPSAFFIGPCLWGHCLPPPRSLFSGDHLLQSCLKTPAPSF
jgi:hypothetical protein